MHYFICINCPNFFTTIYYADVPEAPINPRIIEIAADRVTVAWDMPKDDGGSSIIGYVLEKKESNRRAFHHVAQVNCCFKSDNKFNSIECISLIVFSVIDKAK